MALALWHTSPWCWLTKKKVINFKFFLEKTLDIYVVQNRP